MSEEHHILEELRHIRHVLELLLRADMRIEATLKQLQTYPHLASIKVEVNP